MAIEMKYFEIVQFLIEHGADHKIILIHQPHLFIIIIKNSSI